MAFEETCEGALLAMKQSASYSLTYSNRALNHMSDAWGHWGTGDDHEAIEDILFAISDINVAAGYAGYGYAPFDYVGPWWWYFTNCIGEMGMDAIINAMLNAEPDQIRYFVGLVDAFRQSIWIKPFNQEFYAALARGFV